MKASSIIATDHCSRRVCRSGDKITLVSHLCLEETDISEGCWGTEKAFFKNESIVDI